MIKEENNNIHFSLKEMEKRKKAISEHTNSTENKEMEKTKKTISEHTNSVGNSEKVSQDITPVHFTSPKDEEPADLRYYWAVIRHRKWVVLIVSVLIFLPTLYKVLTEKIIFGTSTQILLKEDGGRGLGMAIQLGLTESQSSLDTLSAISKTTPFLEKVSQKLNQKLKVNIPPSYLSGIITVTPKHETNILEVTTTFEDPKNVIEIANTFATEFIEYNLDLSQKEINQAIETTELQIKENKKGLEKIEDEVQKFLRKEGAASPNQTINMKIGQLANIENTSTGYQMQIKGIESEIVSIKNKLEIESPTLVIETQINKPLHDQLVQLEMELATTKTRRTSNHPEIIAIQKNIDSIKNLIQQRLEEGVKVDTLGRNPVRDNLLTRLASLEAEKASVDAKLISLERIYDELKKEIAVLPERGVVFERLEREKRGIEQIYLKLQTQYLELRSAKDGKGSNLYHIQPAVDTYPIGGKVKQLLALGILVGMIVGIGLAFFLEYLDNTIRTPMDVKTHLGLNILGIIPKFTEGNFFIKIEEPNSIISEVFRLLRNNLRYTSLFGENKIIMVTSSQKMEGKTTVTRNFAVSAALQGKSVILIDADMRKMTLSRLFGIKRKNIDTDEAPQLSAGLSDYLVGEVQLSDIIQKTEINGLRIIPAGTRVPNTAELLQSSRMRELLVLLKNEADNIYIDSPPVLPIVDATILGSEVDGVVVVVGSRLVAIESAKDAVERLRHTRSNILGCIVNMVKEREVGYYRHYYGYYE